jgi:hypothetical protein
MPQFDWRGLLSKWSEEIINSSDAEYLNLPSEVVEAKWLGYPGASEPTIAAAEARLGKTLPPSYREFLRVTNGWRNTSPFIDKLWSVEELDWLSARNQSLIDVWAETLDTVPPIPDEVYFVYGDKQDGVLSMRAEYLKTALEVSDWGDSAIYLLNPQVVTPDGEWEAWFFANWIPGATRYRSFWEMMQAEYQSFLQLDAHETGRFHANKDEPDALSTKLPNLRQELEVKISLWRGQAGPLASLGTADVIDRYNEGIIDALVGALNNVERLAQQKLDTEQLLKALNGLIEALENRWRDGDREQRQRGQSNVLAMAMDLRKAGEFIYFSGVTEGCREAAGIVRWFLEG